MEDVTALAHLAFVVLNCAKVWVQIRYWRRKRQGERAFDNRRGGGLSRSAPPLLKFLISRSSFGICVRTTG